MENIQAQIVLEVLGRPKENVAQALLALSEKLGKEKGVKILEHKLHDPVEVKDSNNLFTAFIDATLEVDNLEQYLYLLFAYMPSHAEIVYPEKMVFDNVRINQIASNLTQRLHSYDALAKKIMVERDIFLKKLKEKAPEVFKEVAASAFRAHDSPAPPGEENPETEESKEDKPKKK